MTRTLLLAVFAMLCALTFALGARTDQSGAAVATVATAHKHVEDDSADDAEAIIEAEDNAAVMTDEEAVNEAEEEETPDPMAQQLLQLRIVDTKPKRRRARTFKRLNRPTMYRRKKRGNPKRGKKSAARNRKRGNRKRGNRKRGYRKRKSPKRQKRKRRHPQRKRKPKTKKSVKPKAKRKSKPKSKPKPKRKPRSKSKPKVQPKPKQKKRQPKKPQPKKPQPKKPQPKPQSPYGSCPGGTCMEVKACTGARHSVAGLCPGPNNIQCCVTSTGGSGNVPPGAYSPTNSRDGSGTACMKNFNADRFASNAVSMCQAYASAGVQYSQDRRQFGMPPAVQYADCTSFGWSVMDASGIGCIFNDARYTAGMQPIIDKRGGFSWNPNRGDIVMWQHHFGIVTQVCGGGQVSMVAMGLHGCRSSGCISISSLRSWGSGQLLGFWTPN
jgi:hypothetical protein